jgi:hypothetical protein
LNLTRSREGAKNDQPFTKAYYPLTTISLVRPGCIRPGSGDACHLPGWLGLPCAGALGERIVRETAAKGSKNYQIVQKLMDRGAKIEATESADLLRLEYGYIKALLEAKTDEERLAAQERYNQVKDKLLEDRDLFIARAIDSSLKEGETGLLFIGASHSVLPKIAGDIEVKCLD